MMKTKLFAMFVATALLLGMTGYTTEDNPSSNSVMS